MTKMIKLILIEILQKRLKPKESNGGTISRTHDLVAPAASPFEYLLFLPNVRAIQYKLGPEKLTWLGNSKVLRMPVVNDDLKLFI